MEKQKIAVDRSFIDKLPERGAVGEAPPNNQQSMEMDTAPCTTGEFITLQEAEGIPGVVIREGNPYYELAGRLVPVIGVVKKGGYGFVPVLDIKLVN